MELSFFSVALASLQPLTWGPSVDFVTLPPSPPYFHSTSFFSLTSSFGPHTLKGKGLFNNRGIQFVCDSCDLKETKTCNAHFSQEEPWKRKRCFRKNIGLLHSTLLWGVGENCCMFRHKPSSRVTFIASFRRSLAKGGPGTVPVPFAAIIKSFNTALMSNQS